MTEMSKPLRPGEIRTATRTDGLTVKLMHAAGGSLFYVETRKPGYGVVQCKNHRFEDTALRQFVELASA